MVTHETEYGFHFIPAGDVGHSLDAKCGCAPVIEDGVLVHQRLTPETAEAVAPQEPDPTPKSKKKKKKKGKR